MTTSEVETIQYLWPALTELLFCGASFAVRPVYLDTRPRSLYSPTVQILRESGGS